VAKILSLISSHCILVGQHTVLCTVLVLAPKTGAGVKNRDQGHWQTLLSGPISNIHEAHSHCIKPLLVV